MLCPVPARNPSQHLCSRFPLKQRQQPPKQAQEKAQLHHTAIAHNRKQESQELNHCFSIALFMLGFSLVEKIGNLEDPITSLLNGL